MRGARIEIEGLERRYGIEVALRGIDLEIAPSERVAITGSSGSGKTTLLHLMGGLDRPDRGRVRIDGEDLGAMADGALSRFRGERIGFVFQHFQLLPHLNALENVLLPALFRGQAASRRARAVELLERVGLGGRLRAKPGELSGGQQQRVAVARALVLEAPLLLCDEPTGSLDRAHGEELLDLLEEMNRELGTTLVVVTHDPWVRDRLARCVVLEDGALLGDGRAGVALAREEEE